MLAHINNVPLTDRHFSRLLSRPREPPRRKKKLWPSGASRLTPVGRESGLVRISAFLCIPFLLNEGNNVVNLRSPSAPAKAGFRIAQNNWI